MTGVLAKSRPALSKALASTSCAASSSKGPPDLPLVSQLSGRVWRVLGRNPSDFSLTGTNMYVVGTGKKRILIDAGEGRPGVLEDLVEVLKAEGCEGLSQIIITHWHHDHLLGLPSLLQHFGQVPVRKYMPEAGTAAGERGPNHQGWTFDPVGFTADVQIAALTDGEVIECEGSHLEVLYTPGHANDHVCLFLKEEQALFTGDNVLGWGTGVFVDLQKYLTSLRRMRDSNPAKLYPAHGPVVGAGEAAPWLEMYIRHREERIEQVVAALRSIERGTALSVEEIVSLVYKDDQRVFNNKILFAAARQNTLLVLQYLQKEGQCLSDTGGFTLAQAAL